MKTRLLAWLNKGGYLDLNILQWALPLFLSVVAILFELVEHISEGDLDGAGFTGEMIIFGFMGPIIIGIIIAWMRQLMIAERQAIAEVHALNRELEEKVIERTAAHSLHGAID